MSENNHPETTGTITLKDSFNEFTAMVGKTSGVNPNLCWHCLSCSGGCPFSRQMDYRPNEIIRLIQLGMKEEVLNASSIWLCVGCYTCSMNCPQAINMAALMDAVRHMAIVENIVIPEPDVLSFHKEVLNSIERYGRTHKLEIMLRHKLQKKDWFGDMDVGLRMFAKRKIDLLPSKVKNDHDIKHLFKLSNKVG
jgi:heterodisulfide reductase subunit C